MPHSSLRDEMFDNYLSYMMARLVLHPPYSLEHLLAEIEVDLTVLEAISQTRYLQDRAPVPKAGNLHLAWEYARNPLHHHHFKQMLRIAPSTFQYILDLIKDDPVFINNSHIPQTAVEMQLAVTLFRMGRYGNGASVTDIARQAGISVGAVELFTNRVFIAILKHHGTFVRKLTEEEIEVEKQWIQNRVGCVGWHDGWLMYDGTIIVLYQKPGLNGDAYYTRKCNYGLNLQVGNVPSNLRIIDYAHGMTGSAHDAAAFAHTAAGKHPEWLFKGREFAWTDSAYPVTKRTIPIHKRPESLDAENVLFDKAVARIRVRSEHAMGALKGRWQCLQGLRVRINCNEDHVNACRWISVAVILHNICVEQEGEEEVENYINEDSRIENNAGEEISDELEDNGNDEEGGKVRRKELVAELVALKHYDRGQM